jgi:hypothetical protein
MQPPPFDRALALASLVRTMRGHYLAVRCSCGAERTIALARMAEDRLVAGYTLAHVALSLSCTGCHNGLDEVHLTAAIFGVGPPARGNPDLGWTIPLVERPAGGARHLRYVGQ